MSLGIPRSPNLKTERFLSRIRMTQLSPMMVETVATRTSTSLPSIVDGELPVLGPAPLNDVHVRHDLDAAHDTGPDRDR